MTSETKRAHEAAVEAAIDAALHSHLPAASKHHVKTVICAYLTALHAAGWRVIYAPDDDAMLAAPFPPEEE